MNDDPVLAQRRNHVGRDRVRVAYGAVPVVLEIFPESDPVRVEIRESARETLVAQGLLSVDELATLPEQVAITMVLKRLRDNAFRAGLGDLSATRCEPRSAQSVAG